MKSIIKSALRAIGYEIRKTSAWPKPDGEPPRDEVIAGPWTYHVLQMANRNYRPPILRYHRTTYGEDHRLKYITYFLDVRDCRVLEIGPFEGHHSVLLEKMGVRENIAIESREDNLNKCRRIKEKYGLNQTTFVHHDLERLYSGQETLHYCGQFDLVFCLGVLYHLPDPGKAIAWFRSQSSRLFLGTHYLEPEEVSDCIYILGGKTYRAKKFREGGIEDPISGMSPISLWFYEEDLIDMLKIAGYSSISVLGKDLQNGTPHITIFAE
jgi:Methyltransferase domain